MDRPFFQIEQVERVNLLRLVSDDGTNRLTRACVLTLSTITSPTIR